jgi:hypothetical protein
MKYYLIDDELNFLIFSSQTKIILSNEELYKQLKVMHLKLISKYLSQN